MHRAFDRPVAVEGKVEVRPMMYGALTYDHRVVDGADAVRFLVHVKGVIEDPGRLLVES
jgi:2-oxoglutarate dehydrogenase E2 component (dihydrolipoamide succinyltransferase)